MDVRWEEALINESGSVDIDRSTSLHIKASLSSCSLTRACSRRAGGRAGSARARFAGMGVIARS
jgi:hypothetical protein